MGKYDDPGSVDFFNEVWRPGVLPSPPDARDYPALPPGAPPAAALPARYALPLGPITTQQDRGSCAAFAGFRIVQRAYADHRGEVWDGSEEFGYAEARRRINHLCRDEGSWPRDIMSIAHDIGIPLESDIPYKSQSICWAPDAASYALGAPRKSASYARCMQADGQPLIDEVKAVLHGDSDSGGHRVMLCLTLTDTFALIGDDGLMPTPDPRSPRGGHAMDIFGWDDELWGGGFWGQNQWWTTWGRGGVFFIRYSDFLRQQDQGGAWRGELWTARAPVKVEPKPEPEPPHTDFFEVWPRTANGDYGTPLQVPAELEGVLTRLPHGGAAVLKRQFPDGAQQVFSKWFEISGTPLADTFGHWPPVRGRDES